MKKGIDKKYPKLFDFRIKYNAGASHAAEDSYHYYTAEDAESAFSFHKEMAIKKGYKMQNISVERRNPYINQWEDFSSILTK